MRHRAARFTVAALVAAIALGSAAEGRILSIPNCLISPTYPTSTVEPSSLQLPGQVSIELTRQNRDGSFSGVLTQGRTRLSVLAKMRGCSSTAAAAGGGSQPGTSEIDSQGWSEAPTGRYQVIGGVEEIQIPSPKNGACVLALTLPKPPPPPPSGPGGLTTRPKPPEPIILRPSSNDPGPGGDEPKDPHPGRTTSNPPPPPPPGRR